MELDNSNQISSEKLQIQNFDVIIAVSGYESRSTYLSGKIDVSKISTKIALAFKENNDILYRKFNDTQFLDWGFTFYDVSVYDPSPLKEILDKNCLIQPKKYINLLIDYSCMPKIWYKTLINYFLNIEEQLVNAKLWFSYSPSIYSRFKSNNDKNIYSEKLPEVKQDKDIALFIGLGNENKIAKNLLHKLKSKVTCIFYADPAMDERYVKDVIENNQDLIQQINEDNIIKYPIQDLNLINNSLTDLCLNYRLENQLVLAPIGPKPFNLMCYILATRYPDIKIWEIKTSGTFSPFDKKALGDLLIYELEFTSEEIDYID
jgi:hypothetical protein